MIEAHDIYIDALRPLPIEEKQKELAYCHEKLKAAISLGNQSMIEYYLPVLCYLRMFDIVEERIDIPKRIPIKLTPNGKIDL